MPDWNKEISFRRKPKERKPEGESLLKKEISFRRKPKAPKPEGESLLKKEISFRRKPKAPTAAVAPVAAAPVVAPTEAWPPRSDEAPVVVLAWPPRSEEPAAAPEAPPVALAPAAVEPPPEAEPKTPFWKQELGRPKRSKPKAEKRKNQPKEPKPKKAPKQPKADKAEAAVPFWKRELSFGGGAARPKRERAPKAKAAAQKHDGTVVGLKVGASQLAAARIHNNGSPELLQLAREPLEDGVVVGGELRDVEALADALRKFFAKHKLPKKGVRLGIANNRIGVRTFEISGIDEPRQLANAIRFRAQETLPIPLDEAVLDWQVLREETDETGTTTRRVLLVVAYRELVDRYVLACRKAGIRLEGVDLEAFAMLRALTDPDAHDEAAPGAQVVVSVGHDRSTFAVSDGRVCEFTRVLAWGGQNLNVAIARALDLTPSEAAPIKHALSLLDDSIALDDFAPERAAAAAAAVRGELQAFARELVSSLRFYQNQPGSLGIAELTLTGGTADLPGLPAELERLIGVDVRVGDPLARVKVGKKLREDDSPNSLAIAIGLGIDA